MTCRRLEVVKHGSSGIWLKVLVVGHKLDDSVPDLCADVISSSRDELQDGIDIPLVLPVSVSSG
jgi:hypothetical protein